MESKTPFPDTLSVDHIKGTNKFILHERFRYNSARYRVTVEAPKGEVTNFGSVPGFIPPMIVPRTGKFVSAYTIHDHLYGTTGENKKYSKWQSDMMLYDGLIESGAKKWRAALVFAGVTANPFAAHRWMKA